MLLFIAVLIPKDTGFPVARNCGLAFRRLSIVDLSPAGNQPMQTLDGRHTIVFNGEIYNLLDIRRQFNRTRFQLPLPQRTETIINGIHAGAKAFSIKWSVCGGLRFGMMKKKSFSGT
jgi:asparagine synthetase B (glutamine-hydrolysing)